MFINKSLNLLNSFYYPVSKIIKNHVLDHFVLINKLKHFYYFSTFSVIMYT